MNKKRNQKRKAQIETRTKNESFRFQVWWNKNKRAPEIADEAPAVNSEIDAICEKDLSEGLLALAEVLDGIRKALGYEQAVDRCSLNGSVIAYILGYYVCKTC